MTRWRAGWLALASIGLAAPAHACIGVFDAQFRQVLIAADAGELARISGDLEKKHAATPTLETGNDLAVARILAKNLPDAIALLRATDERFPGSARVAANLGTALERSGNDVEALEWLRESVKRDANEHEGSEWLHVRLLEVKRALAKDRRWLDKHRVLDLDFGREDVPVAPEILPVEQGRLKGAEQLVRQIELQLAERARFVSKPDPIGADLRASLGDLKIAAALSPLDGGALDPVSDYESALEYGAPRAELVRKRLARYRADLQAMPPKPAAKAADAAVADYPVPPKRLDRRASATQSSGLWKWIGVAAALTVMLIALGAVLDRRRRKIAEATPRPPLPDVD